MAGIGDVSVLLDWLREMGVGFDPKIARRMCRFDWTTDLRYETGRGVRKVLRNGRNVRQFKASEEV